MKTLDKILQSFYDFTFPDNAAITIACALVFVWSFSVIVCTLLNLGGL